MHHNDVFTIYIISLKDKDGLESLNRIKSKIENNETLNGGDIVLLISIVFMKSDLSEKDLLFETADLTNNAKFEMDFLKDQVKAIQLILGDKFIQNVPLRKNRMEIMFLSIKEKIEKNAVVWNCKFDLRYQLTLISTHKLKCFHPCPLF